MSTYSSLIVTDNAIGYWRLNETSGPTAADFTGNGHNATYFGPNITFSKPGLLGSCDTDTAVQLTNTDYLTQGQQTGIQTPLGWQLSASTQMSAECWVEVVGYPVAAQSVAVLIGTGGHGGGIAWDGWDLYIDQNGHLNFQIAINSIGYPATTWSTPLPPGNHHVVATYDGQNPRIYVDGLLVATGGSTGGLPIINTNPNQYNIAIGALPIGDSIGGFPNSYASLNGVIDEVAVYGFALTATQVNNHYQTGLCNPIPPPAYNIAGDDRHYFHIEVWDKTGSTLLDLPKADIESIDLQDSLNGGSGQATIVFRRGFNNIGAVAYLNRVFIWIWHGGIARPANPYWAGYMVDPDQEQLVTTGKITIHLEGDAKQLDRGIVSENINPLVAGNGNLDAADYTRHLITTYGPPGFATYNIPSAMFPLLPLQFSRQKLGSVIDTVIKTGRDNLGQFWTWRVYTDWQRHRWFLIQADQNPNNITSLKFKHIFKREMCSKYTIQTKYRDIVNVILVEGASDPNTGQTVSAVYEDGNSVSSFDAWEDAISVPALVNSDACRAFGEAYLDIHANPQAQGVIELLRPDPSIWSGTWIQAWETASVFKQVRIGSVRVKITPTKITQELDPTAPTPYLDHAIYKMGQNVQGAIKSLTRGFAVNTQQNYVRLGGVTTAGP